MDRRDLLKASLALLIPVPALAAPIRRLEPRGTVLMFVVNPSAVEPRLRELYSISPNRVVVEPDSPLVERFRSSVAWFFHDAPDARPCSPISIIFEEGDGQPWGGGYTISDIKAARKGQAPTDREPVNVFDLPSDYFEYGAFSVIHNAIWRCEGYARREGRPLDVADISSVSVFFEFTGEANMCQSPTCNGRTCVGRPSVAP